ncbi:hypothetical protein CCUS01_15286 [Colletotrichum cuscutae]|uniref:Uncharacterized protein n=1 Tax=Colletotrichum cuscutae TaxID=1209917 RepID=A0AAI9VGJ9_9PEZI|nr:hypothetical protein CCUS01_15286 [Colletotrichum cuscutae]
MEAAVVGLSIDDSPSAAAPYTSPRHRGFGTLDNGEERARCGVCDGPQMQTSRGYEREKERKPGRDFLEGQRDRGLLSMVALRFKGGQGWFRGGGGGVQGSVMVETVTATGQRAAVPSSQTSCASAQPFWNLRVSEAVLISRLRVLQRIRWHELSVGAGHFWMEWAVCAMRKIFLWSEVRGGLGCVVSSCRVEWVRDLCYAFDAIWKIKRLCATGECGRSEEGVERRTLQLLPKHIRFFPLLV